MSDLPLIAILAAGKATRFGGGKLDANCAGQCLGSWVLDAVEMASGTPGVIVTATKPALFAQEAIPRGWTLIPNDDAKSGLGSSVAAAARHATALASPALIILLADMPLVTPDMIAALLADSVSTVATRHEHGRAGVPARFPCSLFETLSGLDSDKGAMAILRNAPAEELKYIAPSTNALLDVDTPTGLRLAAEALEERSRIIA